ncbi:restriction endonuclease subunit S [Flavobacteriaceae bacterium SZ-1-7]|uniref:restriction endonuclease subunit S n=1 Tax=Tamlana sedimenti TaxID=3134126 RepID=UPI0031288358
MKVKLKDVISTFIVPQRDKPKVFDGDIPWCRIEDINGKYLYKSNSSQNVSQTTVDAMNLRVYPVNTLLFTCSATIGVTAITKAELCTNQTFIGLVPSSKIDVEYLYYYLSKIGSQLKKAASITTIPYISRSFFENLQIEIPNSIWEQRKISKVLSDLDAKIEVNNKINQELEAMAKTLYDYWFVQFDFPNANGRPYKSSGGKMVYNEVLKRDIPKDWQVEVITKSCDIVDCLHSKKPEQVEESSCFLLQLENIKDNGIVDVTNKYKVSADDYATWTSRIEVEEDDILMTNAGRVAANAQIPKGLKTGIGRNITAIRPKNINPTYLFLSIRGLHVQEQIFSNTDVGSFFKSFNVKSIKKLEIIRPFINIEDEFEKIVRPLRDKRELNQQQNQKLTELRDWLLPMLMNGQVTVSEAKEQLGMVAEAGAAYERDKEAIDSLFDKINYDYEVGVVVLLTRQILDRTYGKKYVHKMLSNIQFLEELPVFKDLAFKENGWGMHSKVLDKTIANQKYVYFEDLGNERSVLNFNFKHIKEVSIWMQKDDYSKDFVLKVENMLKIYQKSLINKDMDRIELFNTVLECMAVLETDDFEAVRRKMGSWKMHEEGYATKEDKFTPYETQLMIDFIKELK